MDKPDRVQIWKSEENLIIKIPVKELDASNSEIFKELIRIIVSKHRFDSLIIKLQELNICDGEGLAALVYSWRYCNRHGIKLYYCCFSENLNNILIKKGWDKVFDISITLPLAIEEADQYLKTLKIINKTENDLENIFGIPSISPINVDENKIEAIKARIKNLDKAS